ncbi:glycosyltransferase family 4 protein [Extibacter muris]|uniref:glycosyltransferase family 4 protein n=1 Tax=Extibacter muris TaxID=1796622 RepID=UPI001D099C76|nr:glycosyltransferase family 4 protein [Extibacter muris]MCB6202827.1 glycosyltransferase family 4 protein [Extibacter muris]MCQ4664823.1 glycosyltransferase family 4 protein [Extibacter muris]MCQ4694112.1 glycosyltransferase family 4 protein [Extibacter muris]
MNILSITAQKPESTGSGIYLTELVKTFAAQGHKQAVIAGIYEDDAPQFPEGTAFYPVCFSSERLPFYIAGMSDEMPYKSTRYRDMTDEMAEQFKEAFLEAVDRVVEEFRPDLILCHHLYLLTAIVREHLPEHRIYGFCHNTDLRQMMKTPLRRGYIAEQIRRLDAVFVPQTAQAEGVERIYGMETDKIHMSGTGYNQEIFYHKEDSTRRDGVLRLVYAGKIAEKKGVMSLIRCLSRLPYERESLVLRLAGGAGNEEEYREIQRLAEEAPYEVEFLGKLPQRELAKVYNESDIFVLPSFFDGLPLTVIEALACGDKVVVTDFPGIREWLGKEAPQAPVVYVSMPRMRHTDEVVAESLEGFERELAAKIKECAELPVAGRTDITHLSWKNICERILEIS